MTSFHLKFKKTYLKFIINTFTWEDSFNLEDGWILAPEIFFPERELKVLIDIFLPFLSTHFESVLNQEYVWDEIFIFYLYNI